MSSVEKNGIHFHLDAVQDIGGFAPINVEKEHYFWLLTRASITSDEPEFYKYIEISNPFFNKVGVLQNAVYQFLILIHEDLSADLYINDFPVAIEILAKRDMKLELVTDRDIADIRRLKFPDIEIVDTDKVIYCLKVGWKFGLFFDLNRTEKLDIDSIFLTLGKLYRELLFQYVYKTLEAGTQFEEMIKDGWFPFIELLGAEYKSLSEAYQDRFDFENRIERLVGSFDRARIEKITNKWWKNQIFKDKQKILEAGISAFLDGTDEGYINCSKNLLSEVGGIISLQYLSDTGKGKASFPNLSTYIVEKGKTKSGSDYSLLLPVPFLGYLNDVVFSNFNLETGEVDLSRHSSSHGVAKAEAYTKIGALQAILVLDQIYFYI